MCGIAGVVSFAQNKTLPQDRWRNFTDPLKYRGPDDHGEWNFNSAIANVTFFHTRLSIIDLSPTGHQPMTTADEQIVIVFNGEIYNYQTLRKELVDKGLGFKSTSDTEVLLQGYVYWGFHELVKKIDGMFAIALFDKRENALFLARDRFGKKPLYYHLGDRQLIFSSDIRSFKEINGVSLSVDLFSLGYFFAELATPHESTIWKEVKKVEPGSYIHFNSSGIRASNTYWHLSYTENCSLDNESIAEKTDLLLKNAVKKRLVSDVNVSALLSGGIDSSLVVAKMAELSSRKVNTYSVGFEEADFNELSYARKVADRFNTNHTELIIKPQSFEVVNELIWEYGEPFADASMIPTYLISKEVAKSEKVALGGDGGDELFGGYDSYYFALKYDRVKLLSWLWPVAKLLSSIFPSYRTDFLSKLLQQTRLPNYTLLHRNFGFDKNELKKLMDNLTFVTSLDKEHEFIWNQYTPNSKNDLINVLSASLRTRLLNDYLVKVDRASMFASLEMRSPYLDKDLTEFAATLKSNQLFHKAEPKYILKRIASKYFPDKFIHRKKMGFGIPVGTWFRGELVHKLKEVVLGKQKMVDLDYTYIEKLVDEHSKGMVDHTDRLWALYVFHIWASYQ